MIKKRFKSLQFWGVPEEKEDGSLAVKYDLPKETILEQTQKWLKKYMFDSNGNLRRVCVQMYTEEDDFDRAWHRYWYGVVCRIVADKLAGGELDYTEEVMRVFLVTEGTEENVQHLRDIYKFASKEYVSSMLKVFFPDTDEKTGLPIVKSFASNGSIGGSMIKARMPYIERWLSSEMGIVLPKKGEIIDQSGNREVF